MVLMSIVGNEQILGEPSKDDVHPFSQYITIQYDPRVLNQTFDIHRSINIPIKIFYWTNVRDTLLKWMRPFAPLTANLIVYGQQMPQQMIHLNITDKPKWAEVEILQPIVAVDIPTINTSTEVQKAAPPVDETVTFTSSIIISPLKEAPSQAYSIGIKITCPEIGLLKKSVFEEKITFRPTFLPKIQIEPKKTIQIARPHEAVNFNITVTNYANKKMRVQPKIEENSTLWMPTINPSFVDIDPLEKGSFYFSVYAPHDFGWHDTIKTFKINFTTTSFPLTNNSVTNSSYQITLTVNNYGFSLPGFEYLSMVTALLLLIIKKQR